MRPIPTIILLLVNSSMMGQSLPIGKSTHWKIYDISGNDLFTYSIDTIKKFPASPINEDSIHFYLSDLSIWPSNDPPLWMGAHIATFELNGSERKVEISLYGGFFYDEGTKLHYQVAENKIDSWTTFIRKEFMKIHTKTANN